MRECDLLSIHPVYFEDFGDRGRFCCILPLLNLTLGSLSHHGGIKSTKDTVWFLDFNLAREFCDEFAQWSELLVFVSNDFDESITISD